MVLNYRRPLKKSSKRRFSQINGSTTLTIDPECNRRVKRRWSQIVSSLKSACICVSAEGGSAYGGISACICVKEEVFRAQYRLKNNAFSLLELIITIAILSIGIIIVLEALSYSTRMAGLSCDIIDAVLLAEDKMQELEFKEKQGLINKEPREIRAKLEGFDWKYALNLDPDLNLYKLSFNIKWLRANREESLDLNTYLR